jgi:SAM-dependent methyltransferase
MDEREVEGQYERWLRSRSPVALYVRWYLRHRRPREAARLWEQVGPGIYPRVLDVGCAGGFYLLDAHRRGHGGELMAGVDLSETLLGEARARLAEVAAHTEVVLERSSATGLPFEDASFDVVLSNGMAKYLDDADLRRFCSEVFRVLAPGARACVAEFARPVGWGARVDLERIGIPTAHLREGEELAAALSEAGFADVSRFEVDRIRRIPLAYEGAVGTRPGTRGSAGD